MKRALINLITSVNSKKCVSLKVLPVKGKKAIKVITEIHRHYWKGQQIPSINFEKLGKYLGLQSCRKSRTTKKIVEVIP